MRRIASLFLALLSLGLISSCSSEPAFSVFENPQVDGDQIDVTGIGTSGSGLDAASTRLLGEHNGYTFYAARGAQQEGNPLESALCLVTVPEDDPTGGMSGCSSSTTTELHSSRPGMEAMLIPDDFDAADLLSDGWVEVHPNLLAR